MNKMEKRLAAVSILLTFIIGLSGLLSIDFSKSYYFENLYGDSVRIYGHGIYAYDSYLKAAILIGSDMNSLFVGLPLFVYCFYHYSKRGDDSSALKLISLYATTTYYAASLCLGVTYNKFFLLYIALFTSNLFALFYHIRKLSLKKCLDMTRGVKLFLSISGLALIIAWVPDIIASFVSGASLELIEVYTTEVTYVLDMGIIGPLCFLAYYLSIKRDPLSTIILAILLTICILVGIMMFFQTLMIYWSGLEVPVEVMVTKTLSFVFLSGFAGYFNHKLYRSLESDN